MNKLYMLIAICSTSMLAAGCGDSCGYNQVAQPVAVQSYDQSANVGCSNQNVQNQDQNSKNYNQPTAQNQGWFSSDKEARQVNQPTTAKTGTDQEINKEINGTIGSGWFSKGYENVQYSVNNGAVTLTGSVQSLEDKNKIQDKVSKINGVTQVNNQIQVTPQQK